MLMQQMQSMQQGLVYLLLYSIVECSGHGIVLSSWVDVVHTRKTQGRIAPRGAEVSRESSSEFLKAAQSLWFFVDFLCDE